MNNEIKFLFKERKSRISEALREFLTRPENVELLELPWGGSLAKKILDYTAGGKCLRGNLVLLGAEAAGVDLDLEPSYFKAAAAVELFQSGILMHDDIIDGDLTRRGRPSAHAEFAEILKNQGVADFRKQGESVAVCLGDICLMLTFALLNETASDLARLKKVNYFWGREFAKVGDAEIADTYYSSADVVPSAEAILDLYRGKTAGYTFRLPLLTGVMLADGSDDLRNRLDKYAMNLGVVFQIKDDELGIFGSEEELGKPVGSDIRENKKTIYWQALFSSATPAEKEELAGIFGHPAPTKEMVERVRYLLETKGIRRAVAKLADSLLTRAGDALEGLKAPRVAELRQLIALSAERRS